MSDQTDVTVDTTVDTPIVERDMRAITRCYDMGWHSHMAGPCFHTYEQAIAHRDYEERRDAEDRFWRTRPYGGAR